MGTWDPECIYLGYPGVYSGAIAVKVFFFISGLLVTNSLLQQKSPVAFVLGRFFRIWPALLVLLLVTALVVGPLCSGLGWREYFMHGDPYRYFWKNALLNSDARLPGVFAHNPLPNLVNGALWTLSYEVGGTAPSPSPSWGSSATGSPRSRCFSW